MWKSLRDPAQPKPAPPVRHLPHRHRIDALVDPRETLPPVDIHKRGDRAGDFNPALRGAVLGHLHRLHAGAEAHGGVGLRKAAGHAARDAGGEVAGAEGLGVVFGFGGDEEEDGAFGGGFDPGPGDEALVIWERGYQ